jgi:hypothetical protein
MTRTLGVFLKNYLLSPNEAKLFKEKAVAGF